jgi:CheY-specific phosphatase CheX
MSGAGINDSAWLEAAVHAVGGIAATTFGIEGAVEMVAAGEQATSCDCTACIALVGEEVAIQLGITSSKDGCQALVRSMLCREPDEPLEEADITDAMGEIANILAGQVKTDMASRGLSMNLGLPIFLHGTIELTDALDVSTGHIRIGDIPIILTILKKQNSS